MSNQSSAGQKAARAASAAVNIARGAAAGGVYGAAVEAAATRAAEVPLENGRLNARVYELGVQLRGNSNPACLSDLTSALYLAQGGVKACVLNINANLGLIKKEETIASLKEAMLELLLQAICY